MRGGLPEAPAALIKIKKLASLTDTAIRIPIIGIRFGLDFLLGLFPVIGDVVTLLIAAYMVRIARKELGVPEQLRKAMIRNIIIDFVISLVPVIGDIADLFYKANAANAKMVERWWVEQNRNQLSQYTRQSLDDWDKENGPS